MTIQETYSELENEISELRLTKNERNKIESKLKPFLTLTFTELNKLSEINKKLLQENVNLKIELDKTNKE